MSDILDHEIKELLQQNRLEQAFELVMNSYKERLYWHIRNMVVFHEDADDVLQNSLIKIWRNLSNFEGRSKVYSWCYRIASNEALNFLEKRKRKKLTSLDDDNHSISNALIADEYFDGDAASAILLEAVGSLPEKQRQVFNMKYFEDLKYSEISEILQLSEGGLKASYHHAVKKIEEFVRINHEQLNHLKN